MLHSKQPSCLHASCAFPTFLGKMELRVFSVGAAVATIVFHLYVLGDWLIFNHIATPNFQLNARAIESDTIETVYNVFFLNHGYSMLVGARETSIMLSCSVWNVSVMVLDYICLSRYDFMSHTFSYHIVHTVSFLKYFFKNPVLTTEVTLSRYTISYCNRKYSE